jgi:hypothetical protein
VSIIDAVAHWSVLLLGLAGLVAATVVSWWCVVELVAKRFGWNRQIIEAVIEIKRRKRMGDEP